jgi:hypothetical protein
LHLLKTRRCQQLHELYRWQDQPGFSVPAPPTNTARGGAISIHERRTTSSQYSAYEPEHTPSPNCHICTDILKRSCTHTNQRAASESVHRTRTVNFRPYTVKKRPSAELMAHNAETKIRTIRTRTGGTLTSEPNSMTYCLTKSTSSPAHELILATHLLNAVAVHTNS